MTVNRSLGLDLPALAQWSAGQVSESLCWTVSGSHLYGFASPASDIDVRGCFAAPLGQLIGLKSPTETHESRGEVGGRAVESVAHEVGKFLRLLIKHNGYILEQITSPIIVYGAEFLQRLRPLAIRCVTRHCVHHYRGFLLTQRKAMEREPEVRAKTILHAYRIAMTGVHLLQTGAMEAHLPTLIEQFGAHTLSELIARKIAGDATPLTQAELAHHCAQLDTWERRLEEAHSASTLPTESPVDALHCFLVELRLSLPSGPN